MFDLSTSKYLGQFTGWIILLILWTVWPAQAQSPPDTLRTQEHVETLLEALEDESEASATELLERLADLADHPLDINTASAEDLIAIPFITPMLAQSIVAFRETFGLFASMPELRAVEGMTQDIFLSSRPYLTIGTSDTIVRATPSPFPQTPRFQEVLNGLEYDIIQRYGRRLDLGRGYDITASPTPYLGSPERLYTRIRATYGRQVSLNLTSDKDPAERFVWEPASNTFGYDFLSAHLALRNMGRLKTLVVGDYVANFGQGLTLWRQSGFGKSREATRTLFKRGRGLTPYGSTDENHFFRGLGATVALTPALSASAFFSRRSLDATVLTPDPLDPFDEPSLVTTLSTTGLHRTPSELAKKDALTETLLGGNVTYQFRRGEVGAVGYTTRFDPQIQPNPDPYRHFAFRGEQATMVSLYGQYAWTAAQLYGEVARAPSGAWGGLGGALVPLFPTSEVALLIRHFPADFTALHGYAFGERNGATQNETGLYLGLRVRPHTAWQIAAYFDQFRFPWLRFGIARPTTGYEALVFVEHRPERWIRWYVQARTETKEVGIRLRDTQNRLLASVAPETRQSMRLHGEYAFSRTLDLRARVEITRFVDADDAVSWGFLVYQDVRWLALPNLQLTARLAFFDTDGFDARVYAFEHDLLYVFSNPAFSGRGQRMYLLARYTLLENLDFWLKFATTRFEDVRTVGSGLDEVSGNRLRDLRAQLRWRF